MTTSRILTATGTGLIALLVVAIPRVVIVVAFFLLVTRVIVVAGIVLPDADRADGCMVIARRVVMASGGVPREAGTVRDEDGVVDQ